MAASLESLVKLAALADNELTRICVRDKLTCYDIDKRS
jgi:hypothetical protein